MQQLAAERAVVLHRIADLYDERAEQLAQDVTREMGKPITAARGEMKTCAGIFRYYAEQGPEMIAREQIEPATGGTARVVADRDRLLRLEELLHRRIVGQDEAVEAVQAGLDEAVEAADAAGHVIRVGQLVTAMRHADRAQEIAELAVRHREAGVVGFDIAGAEAGFPPSRFADTFTWLAAHHLPVTVHAGEGDGLDSVRSALVDGRALRLGHGVRLAEDISVEYGGVDEDGEQLDELTGLVDLGETAAWVRDRQIALEVCPSSNLQTGAVDAAAGIAGHPIDLLVQLGFRVTVNTDNRLVSDVSLTDELYLLAETFGYSLSELLDLQLNAAEAAFLSVDEREDLAEILVAGWGEVISGDAVGPVLEELDDEDEDD